MTGDEQLRFGLVGTGYWARVAHARALASTPGAAITAVWGRNPEAAASLAAEFGATAHQDFDAFLAEVDAVAFAVPPDVQNPLAIRAAAAGRHLLLEKPVALDAGAADALASAVETAGVASVVFFTTLFQPDIRAWLREVAETAGWAGGSAIWLASVYSPSSPFNTRWRREKGGLWDIGPHAVSLLWTILGPVRRVTADAGRGDLTHLVLHHEGGATSTATLTLGAPEAADSFRLDVWGEHGRQTMPNLADDAVAALRVAVTELIAQVRSGDPGHLVDVRFGRNVTHVLADAQRQLDAMRVQQR
jgi:predicted dehydrogenase